MIAAPKMKTKKTQFICRPSSKMLLTLARVAAAPATSDNRSTHRPPIIRPYAMSAAAIVRSSALNPSTRGHAVSIGPSTLGSVSTHCVKNATPTRAKSAAGCMRGSTREGVMRQHSGRLSGAPWQGRVVTIWDPRKQAAGDRNRDEHARHTHNISPRIGDVRARMFARTHGSIVPQHTASSRDRSRRSPRPRF